MAAEALRIKGKVVEGLSLKASERTALALLPSLSANLKRKFAKPNSGLTVAEVAGIMMAVAEAFPEGEPKQQISLLMVVKKVMDCLQQNIVEPVEPAKEKEAKVGLMHQLRSRYGNLTLPSGGAFRSWIAPSTNFTNTSKRRWAGRTRTSTNSASASSFMLIRC